MEKDGCIILRLISRIQEVSDLLYQQKLKKGYDLFNTVIGELTVAVDSLLTGSEGCYEGFDGQRFLVNLSEAMKAMENRDSVLLADILTYEIIGQLQELAM